jgi:restriction system protein
MARVKYKYDDFMNPLILALKQLGGSGTNEEIDSRVGDIFKIPSEQLDILHNPEKGGISEIEYRLHWTRTYLKKYGVIENSSRGVWSLTPKGSAIETVDQREVVRVVKEQTKSQKEIDLETDGVVDKEVRWQEELLDVVLKMPPSSFERLIQRMLRESGFIQVAVTGQTGDGAPAIDLVDGDQLVEKLKQLSLGVKAKDIIVQEVIIEQEWFASL